MVVCPRGWQRPRLLLFARRCFILTYERPHIKERSLRFSLRLSALRSYSRLERETAGFTVAPSRRPIPFSCSGHLLHSFIAIVFCLIAVLLAALARSAALESPSSVSHFPRYAAPSTAGVPARGAGPDVMDVALGARFLINALAVRDSSAARQSAPATTGH